MPAHVFVDESKKRGFLLVAAYVLSGDVQTTHKAMEALRLPHQGGRVHFKDERPVRKHQILDVIESRGVTADIYVGPQELRELDPRRACLEQLVEELGRSNVKRLVIELDESLVRHDKRWLYTAIRSSGIELDYQHLRAREESLLWIPDAVAWCWAAGGQWRERVRRSIVAQVLRP
jgi:predicted phosphatase